MYTFDYSFDNDEHDGVPTPRINGPHRDNGARQLHYHWSTGDAYYDRNPYYHDHDGAKYHEHEGVGPAIYPGDMS